VGVRLVSPGYFSALRLHLLRGRTFNDSDAAGSQAVIVISASMARRFWGQEDPLGKHLTISFSPQFSREIVGIVGDVKQDGLDVADTEATLYVPMGQISVPALGGWRSFGMTLAVRTSTDPAAMSSAIAGAIHQVNADQPVAQVLTMDQVLTQSISSQRFNMLLLAAFAGLALLLAAVGIYSVLSYTVRRRSREIGIRIALGAQLRDVLRMVVLDGMKPTLIGLAIGLAGAFALGRVLAGLVFGVSPSDPATFAAVSFLLAMVALFAILVPAFRATRVDPMTVLRDE
jgi:predicted permease